MTRFLPRLKPWVSALPLYEYEHEELSGVLQPGESRLFIEKWQIDEFSASKEADGIDIQMMDLENTDRRIIRSEPDE